MFQRRAIRPAYEGIETTGSGQFGGRLFLVRASRPAYEGIETVGALKIVAWRFELSDLTVAA